MTPEQQTLNTLLKDVPSSGDLGSRIGAFVNQLQTAAGDNLASLVLFGGLARGRYRPGLSDVNVLVVLKRVGRDELGAIAPALRAAWRSVRVEPMIVAEAQLEAVARAFPTKVLDIKAYHVLLAGADVLAAVNAPPERVLWRVEQELQNMAIRLRRKVIAEMDDDAGLVRELAEIARPLAIELTWLLRMSGRSMPPNDRTAAIFAAAAKEFGLDAGALGELAELRAAPTARSQMADLCVRVIESMTAAAAVAGQSNS